MMQHYNYSLTELENMWEGKGNILNFINGMDKKRRRKP